MSNSASKDNKTPIMQELNEDIVVFPKEGWIPAAQSMLCVFYGTDSRNSRIWTTCNMYQKSDRSHIFLKTLKRVKCKVN